jgi:hypothetical protein
MEEQAAQPEEIKTPTGIQPEVEKTAGSQSPKKPKRFLKPLLFFILGIALTVLVIGLVFVVLRLSKVKIPGGPLKGPTPEPTSLISTPIPKIESQTKNKIFFVENKNVFVIEKTGENKVRITNFPETDFGHPQSLQVIDDEYLGFYKCDTETGNFNCGIYQVSVVSKQPEKLIKEDPDKLMLQLGWFDKKTFAYTVESSQTGVWSIFLYKDENKTTIEEIPAAVYGRGGFVEDSSKISFSPDGSKILQIATSNPRSPMDFNVHVYDLEGNELAKIDNSTQPAWLDDKNIIFRRSGEGLYFFDLSTKIEKKIEGASDNALEPKVLDGKSMIVYWVNEGNGQVWLLDIASNKNEKLLDDASDPLWISEEEILVSENKACPDCMGRTFSTTSVSVLNIKTKSKTKLFDADEGIGGGNIFYDVTYYNSRWSD